MDNCAHKLRRWELVTGEKLFKGIHIPAPERNSYISVDELCIGAAGHTEPHQDDSDRIWR